MTRRNRRAAERIVSLCISALPREQQFEWSELQRGAQDPLDTLDAWTPEHRLSVRTALADYASSSTDVRRVLSSITCWSHRMGVALGCVIARRASRHLLEPDWIPRKAIAYSEFWVRGEATAEQCRVCANSSFPEGPTDARYSAFFVARSVAYAASYLDDTLAALAYMNNAAYSAATAAAYETPSFEDGRREELWRLCPVIAESLRTGAVSDWIG